MYNDMVDTNVILTDSLISDGKQKRINDSDLVDEIFAEIDLLVDSFRGVIDSQSVVFQIDGTIIGTGKADFTQGNTTYVLNQSDKKFHLIDVPGIEGNESKYEAMVKQAVAKAHLVFYVNGTNKKPEKVTAEKIKSYLNRGTQVCPLLNVRGNADSYEFEEDRVSLTNEHNNAGLLQTTQVLEECIGKKRLLPAYCIQGLLAFSSLAKTKQKISTIHSSRQNDLILQQKNFLKYFNTYEAMKEFSGINNVANVLKIKAETYREDIIESNKVKVKELLNENSSILNCLLSDYHSFSNRVESEFSHCENKINEKFDSFKNGFRNGRKKLIEKFFTDLVHKSDDIVEDYFGDEETISWQLKRESNKGHEKLEKESSEHFEKCVDVLLVELEKEMQRLMEDIQRVEFQTNIEDIKSLNKVDFQSSSFEMGFDLNDFGKFAFNITSYSLSGFAIGTAFPGLGNILGAITGAVVGLLSSVLSIFMSKAKKIRKAQAKVQSRIDDARISALEKVDDNLEEIFNDMYEDIISPIKEQIGILKKSINTPIEIINQQIKIMTNLSNKVEAMPYGTIQAI